ncbi:MAG: hypothetical protein AAGM67_04365, partial [Bacteroidota bacterium]
MIPQNQWFPLGLMVIGSLAVLWTLFRVMSKQKSADRKSIQKKIEEAQNLQRKQFLQEMVVFPPDVDIEAEKIYFRVEFPSLGKNPSREFTFDLLDCVGLPSPKEAIFTQMLDSYTGLKQELQEAHLLLDGETPEELIEEEREMRLSDRLALYSYESADSDDDEEDEEENDVYWEKESTVEDWESFYNVNDEDADEDFDLHDGWFMNDEPSCTKSFGISRNHDNKDPKKQPEGLVVLHIEDFDLDGQVGSLEVYAHEGTEVFCRNCGSYTVSHIMDEDPNVDTNVESDQVREVIPEEEMNLLTRDHFNESMRILNRSIAEEIEEFVQTPIEAVNLRLTGL